MHLSNYLESTYLKTSIEAGVSEEDNRVIVSNMVNEAIDYNFKLIMIRPEYISCVKEMILKRNSALLVGTVVDFPLGNKMSSCKIKEAKKAISLAVDELDFVANYNLFKRGNIDVFDNEIKEGIGIAFKYNKIIKWIIETGALSTKEIFNISKRISLIVNDYYLSYASNVFIKTCTGYYGGHGAQVKDIKIIKSAIKDLRIKASGGIKTRKQCQELIKAGADRIGTSKAMHIYNQK